MTYSDQQMDENWTVSFMMNSQRVYFVSEGNYTTDLHSATQFRNWELASKANDYLKTQGYHANIDLIDATIFQ
jgi:hypothetical protein